MLSLQGTRHPYRTGTGASLAEPRCAVTEPGSISQTDRELQEGRDCLNPPHAPPGPRLHRKQGKGPAWPGRFSFSFEAKDPESGHLWEELRLPGPAPLTLGRACWGPRNRAAEDLREQGPSLQTLAVSGLSSRQTPKLSSAVRQSTGRSWVPLPQVTEHYR